MSVHLHAPGHEDDPEVQAWLASATTVLNEWMTFNEKRLQDFADDFRAYGTASMVITPPPSS